jgi:acetyl-CoA carboxylase alpha subunit
MKDEHITAVIWAMVVILVAYMLFEKFKNVRFLVSTEGARFGVEATEKRGDAQEIAAENFRIIEGR